MTLSELYRQTDPTSAARLDAEPEYPALLGIAIVAVLALGLQVLVLVRRNMGFGPLTFKLWGLSLVVFAGLAVLALDPAEGQANAAWGLLGVIAGYIFGRSQQEDRGARGP